MNIIRILYITGYYPPPETACGVRAYYFVRELIKRGHEVLVVEMTSRAPSAGVHFGEKIIRLPYSIGFINRTLDLFKKVYVCEGMIRRAVEKYLKPDVIISSWPTHDSVFLGYRLSMSLKVPLVLDIQDLADYYRDMFDKNIVDPLMNTFIFNNIYKAMSMAWKVITVTEPFKRIIELRTNRNDVEIVYNGVDVQKFEIIRNTIFGENKKVIIIGVFLGDLSWHYHMLDRILHALYILKRLTDKHHVETLKNLRLKVIGSGKYLQEYKDLTLRLGLAKMIVYTEYLVREDLIKTLILSDFGISGRPAIDNIWIKASIRTTLYEYMAAGLPVFSFGPNNSYTQHFIKRNNLGMYVCSDNPKVLASYMLDFLLSLENFDGNSIRKVSQLYDWSELAKRFAIVVEGLNA